MRLIKIIKNGFNNSIGWNLGNKYKSIHRLALFTSTPIIGTKNKEINVIKKIIGERIAKWRLHNGDWENN